MFSPCTNISNIHFRQHKDISHIFFRLTASLNPYRLSTYPSMFLSLAGRSEQRTSKPVKYTVATKERRCHTEPNKSVFVLTYVQSKMIWEMGVFHKIYCLVHRVYADAVSVSYQSFLPHDTEHTRAQRGTAPRVFVWFLTNGSCVFSFVLTMSWCTYSPQFKYGECVSYHKTFTLRCKHHSLPTHSER